MQSVPMFRVLCWNFRTIYGAQEPSRNRVVVPGPPGYIGWRNRFHGASIPGLLKSLKILSLYPDGLWGGHTGFDAEANIETHGVHLRGFPSQVGRVLSFSPVVGIGTPPTPHPRASVCPHLVPGGGALSLAREGMGESQFRRGDINCATLYIYALRKWCPSLADLRTVVSPRYKRIYSLLA
jgi:hypothetical protein